MVRSDAHSSLASVAGLSEYLLNVPGDTFSICSRRLRIVPVTSEVSSLGEYATISSTAVSTTPAVFISALRLAKFSATFPPTLMDSTFGCSSMSRMTSVWGRRTESSRIFAGSVHVASMDSICGFLSMTRRRFTPGSRSRISRSFSTRKSGSKYSTLGNRPTRTPMSMSWMFTPLHSESSSSTIRSMRRSGSR